MEISHDPLSPNNLGSTNRFAIFSPNGSNISVSRRSISVRTLPDDHGLPERTLLIESSTPLSIRSTIEAGGHADPNEIVVRQPDFSPLTLSLPLKKPITISLSHAEEEGIETLFPTGAKVTVHGRPGLPNDSPDTRSALGEIVAKRSVVDLSDACAPFHRTWVTLDKDSYLTAKGRTLAWKGSDLIARSSATPIPGQGGVVLGDQITIDSVMVMATDDGAIKIYQANGTSPNGTRIEVQSYEFVHGEAGEQLDTIFAKVLGMKPADLRDQRGDAQVRAASSRALPEEESMNLLLLDQALRGFNFLQPFQPRHTPPGLGLA